MARRWAAVIFLLLALYGCAPTVETEEAVSAVSATIWPTQGWQTADPAQLGMDVEKLSQLDAVVQERDINLHSLLIIRNGKIVYEQYYGSNDQNTLHTQYSVTKSFTSTLVGIALDQGKLGGVDQKVMDLLPNRSFDNISPEKEAMSMKNLLTMASGLDWEEGDAAYMAMYRSPDWVNMVMDLPMAGGPGSEFNYCSGCSHVLSGILAQTLGPDVERFARENLFKPLGITRYRWETDSKGIPIGGWGLNLTARDMAKLGYLFLQEGQWEGKQFVSTGWVREATDEHIPASEGRGYGYQWWIYPKNQAYAALGRDGQTIYVIPHLEMIIVTTAEIPEGHGPIHDLIDNYIIPAAR
jgi:CubicO group peptidase (beta-lactamase class C family)